MDSEAGTGNREKDARKTVPKPFGKSKKRASVRLAYLKRKLEIERQNLISLASENPHLKKEVNELLSKVAKHRHTYKNKVKTKKDILKKNPFITLKEIVV